jgi:hypothetical protein
MLSPDVIHAYATSIVEPSIRFNASTKTSTLFSPSIYVLKYFSLFYFISLKSFENVSSHIQNLCQDRE